ncbi:MAG: flavodoxin [Methanomicrobiales archaeon]|nr:flavodoxin [Methanomicrobiales archaeon]
MAARVLVAYTSKKGSTAGIAEAVAKELKARGLVVEVSTMETVTSLAAYDAVVLGVPVYTGRIMSPLALFVARHRDALGKLPVAAFAAGIAPVFPKTGEVSQFTDQLSTALQPVRPVSVTMFAGRLDPKNLSFVERGLTALLKVPTGDFRDWKAIAAWAAELPAKMGLSGRQQA